MRLAIAAAAVGSVDVKLTPMTREVRSWLTLK